MQKKAFSIAELLVASIIVGIVAIVGIQSAKKSVETYDNYFYAAYNILTKAVYNAYLQPEPDGGDNIFNNSNSLCRALTNFINTTRVECNNTINQASDIATAEPSFVAMNGMAFYITGNQGEINVSNQSGAYTFSEMPRFRGRIVAVDLNGAKRPNSYRFNGNDLPDTVFFMLINVGNGSAIPIGLPDIDGRYFQVRVILPEYQYECTNPADPTDCTVQDDEDHMVRLQPFEADGTTLKPISEDNPMINKTPPMSFHQARIFAWGDDRVATHNTHEGFYSAQPMSYASLLANHMPISINKCDSKVNADEIAECRNALARISDTKTRIWDNFLREQMPGGEGTQPWNYYIENNEIRGFTMKSGPNRSRPFNVSRAQNQYGCTPNNSECYIIPLRN